MTQRVTQLLWRGMGHPNHRNGGAVPFGFFRRRLLLGDLDAVYIQLYMSTAGKITNTTIFSSLYKKEGVTARPPLLVQSRG